MKYIVKMPEVWIQDVEVEADSPAEARKKCADGEGDFIGVGPGNIEERPGFEFSHSLENVDEWEVEEA